MLREKSSKTLIAGCIAKTIGATCLGVALWLAAFIGLAAMGIPIIILAPVFWIAQGFIGYQSERLWNSRKPERWAVAGVMLGPIAFPAFWYCKENYEATNRKVKVPRGPQQEAEPQDLEPVKPLGMNTKKWWMLAGGVWVVAILGVLYGFGACDSMLISHGVALNMNKCYQELGGGWRCCGPLGTGNRADCDQIDDNGNRAQASVPTSVTGGNNPAAFDDQTYEERFKAGCQSAYRDEGSSAAALERFCDCAYASLVDQVGLHRLEDLSISLTQKGGNVNDLPYDVQMSAVTAYAECMSKLAY